MRTLQWISGLGLTIWALLAWLGTSPGSLDDLFLVLRAGRDPLALEDAAVLGCSSPLDVVLKSLAVGAAGGSLAGPVVSTVLLQLAAALGGVWILCGCHEGTLRPRLEGSHSVVPILVGLALGVVLAEGASYLLEGPALALSLLLCMAASKEKGSGRLVPWAFAALSLVRPEGALIGVPWALMLQGRVRVVALASSVIGAAAWGGWLALRGSLPLPAGFLPLSFHVKHGPWLSEAAAGAAYVGSWLRTLEGGVCGALLVLGLLGSGVARRRALLGSWSVLLVALEGGDGYVGARLLLPAVVLAIGSAAAAPGRLQVVGLAVLTLTGVPRVVSGGQVVASGQLTGWRVDLEPEQEVVRALQGLQVEAGRTVRVVHRDHQVLLWLDPGLSIRDASGLSEPRVAALPAEGAVRHGRDAFLLLSAEADVLLLDHQRFRAEDWVGREWGPALTSEASRWIGAPRTRAEVTAWSGEWELAAIPIGRFACNVLLRSELAPAAARSGWRVASSGAR